MSANDQLPMSAEQARAFVRRLADFVVANHMKPDEGSPQRGMTYEYLDFAKKGQADQFVQGEALDTMHDGAWLPVATVSARRATGDAFYQSVLTVPTPVLLQDAEPQRPALQ